MKSAISAALLVLLATAAAAEGTNPVLGDWEWNPTRGQCKEVHSYRSDGTATFRSGDEVLEKTYTVSDAGGGMFLVEMTVVSSNGGKDCLGSPTPVGAKSSVYVMPLNGGGYFTCAEPDGMSCYGSASRRAAAGDS